MKNFYAILAAAILATGCAQEESCTPSQTMHDGTVIHGPKDSGTRISDGYFAEEQECYAPESYWDWPEYAAWQQGTLDSKNNIDGIYNFSMTSYVDQENQILRDYEFQSPDYDNSEVFYDAANAPTTKAEFAIVRGPSFRAVEESCNEELKETDAEHSGKHLDDVPNKLEFIRGAENMTLAEAEAEREKLMFRGDNWFWPSPESKCANVEENHTLRSKIRSSEKKSEIGESTQCPGMEMFSKITDTDFNWYEMTEDYSHHRSESNDHVDLTHYPAELDQCRQVCFVNKNVITGHRYDANSGGLFVKTIREDKTLSVKVPYRTEGYSTNIHSPGAYPILKDQVSISVDRYYELLSGSFDLTTEEGRDAYAKTFEFNKYDVQQLNSTGTKYIFGNFKTYFLADEEQRIACTKCETQQFAQMCRFPKNEIFVVRKK